MESYIEFKYLLHRSIDLGNGGIYAVPYKLVPSEILGQASAVPHFDLEKIHRVKLLNEAAEVPEQEPGESDRAYQEVVDDAYSAVRENRRRNRGVRDRLKHYVANGTIEIVNDTTVRRPVVKTESKPESTEPKKPAKSK